MRLKFAALILACLAVTTPAYAWNDHYYPNDFDGDGISDLCIWRPSTAEWFCAPSTGQVIPGWTPVGAGPGSKVQWGLPGDILVPGDYDGDNITDPAVARPGTMNWYVRKSTGGTMVLQMGLNGDLTLTGHFYDGVGADDFTVYRPSNNKLYCKSVGGSLITRTMSGGISGTHGDFGYQWSGGFAYIFTKHSGNTFRRRFTSCPTGGGNYTDLYPLSHSGVMKSGAYLAGDLQFDYAHFVNNVWTIYPGGSGLVTPLVVNWGWGLPSDVPVKGDFDGDSRADLAVYNNGAWRVYSSGAFYGSPPPHMSQYGGPGDYWLQWGVAGDIPIE